MDALDDCRYLFEAMIWECGYEVLVRGSSPPTPSPPERRGGYWLINIQPAGGLVALADFG